ncbi:MAG: SGNH/GDSL hydrolase family protein [Bacillota bacterium]|nr:SGNH/GDSL hydrolase family protein [Bacillota bacterium]
MNTRLAKTLAVEQEDAAGIEARDLVWLDARTAPLALYGFYDARAHEAYARIPPAFARTVEYLGGLDTAGGRLRFATDSAYVAIKATMPSVTRFCHMTLCASSGFDLYLDQDGWSTYHATFYPPVDMTTGYAAIIHFPDKRLRCLTIDFPLYNRVDSLLVGLEGQSLVDQGASYRPGKPIVFYGSSITQGGCASRPGNAYPAMISRKLNMDYLNLGFSGRARAEPDMARYIAQLAMNAFVFDYDYNAPDEAHLMATHDPFYQIIREVQPELPILFVSRPNFDSTPQYLDPKPLAAIRRRDVVYQTYIKAVQSGDNNIYYIDGLSLFGGEGRDCCTVDATHPNDLGFWRMADVIGQMLRNIFQTSLP